MSNSVPRRDFVREAIGAGAAGLMGAAAGLTVGASGALSPAIAFAEGGEGGAASAAAVTRDAAGLSYVNTNLPAAAIAEAAAVPADDTALTPADPEIPQVADIAATEASWKCYAAPSPTPLSVKADNVKRLLVVVDYQNDFVDGGVFGHIEPAIAIEDALYDVVKSYQDAGDIVIYTQDTHPADTYPYTREGQFNPPHCIPGTRGWEIYGRVAELLTPEKAIQVKKPTYGSRNLPSIVQNIMDQGIAIESIEFAGVSTTCRVLHNAIILYNFFPDLMMIFDARTTASYTDEKTYEQLKELEGWGFVIKW